MINDIYLLLSPSHKKDIRRMDENVSDIQKENRIRRAQLIEKQSELSARQHALSEKKLVHSKLKEENKSKKKIMERYQKEVDDYQSRINYVNKEILQIKMNLKALTTQISQVNLPNIAPVKTSISKRKKNITENQDKMKTLKKEVKNLDSQKDELIKLIDSKQKSLLQFNSREEKVSQTLQIPIDDLRLEEITVTKLEQSVLQMSNEINTNDSLSYFNEELLVKKIEEQNEKKKKQINQIKQRIELLKSQSSTPKSNKISKTPTKRLIKTQPVKYDENRLLRFSSTINSFKERQKMIDQLENTTTNVQIAWAADQKQIEDSWMGKMDDMQVLQKKVDEIENLVFDIDELSGKIHQLKEEELSVSEKKSEFEKNKSKIESKLSEISEFHDSMQRQVDDYIKKKEKIDKLAQNLVNKKKKLSHLQDEVRQLEKNYKQYYSKVKTIENKVDEIKNSFNITASQTQIPEPFDRVKFDDYLIPKKEETTHYSKTSITPQSNNSHQNSNTERIDEKNEEPSTPVLKKKNYFNRSFTPKHDKLSDSTFSVRELEKDESTFDSVANSDSITKSFVRYNSSIHQNSTFDNSNYNNNSQPQINDLDNKQNNYDSSTNITKQNRNDNSLNNKPKSNTKTNHKENNSDISNEYSNHSKYSSINDIKYKNNKIDKSSDNSGINKSNKSSSIRNKNSKYNSQKGISQNNEINSNRAQNSSSVSNNKNGSISNTNNDQNSIAHSSKSSKVNKNNTNTNSGIRNSALDDKANIDSDNNQDSQRSEIEIEFSDNENSKSVSQSFAEKDHSHNSNDLILSTDDKLNSMKKIIQEKEIKEELILSKYEKGNKENQYSSDYVSFNPKEYEAILNCTDSSRSTFIDHPNDTTFNQEELEDDEEIENNPKSIEYIEEEEEENDVFDNLSTSYKVHEDSNPIFPTPDLSTDSIHNNKNFNEYESSKETISNDRESQTSEYKNFYSESIESQITPTKKPVHPSRIDIESNVLDTPNPSRYRKSHQMAHADDESDEEFNNLVKEAQKAIEFPLLKSKYQSP